MCKDDNNNINFALTYLDNPLYARKPFSTTVAPPLLIWQMSAQKRYELQKRETRFCRLNNL